MANTLSKNTINFGGFTYPDIKTPIDKPDGALITDGYNWDEEDTSNIASFKFNRVDINSFKEMVGRGDVKDILLSKDGELELAMFRKGMRSDNINKASQNLAAAAGIAGAANVASAQTEIVAAKHVAAEARRDAMIAQENAHFASMAAENAMTNSATASIIATADAETVNNLSNIALSDPIRSFHVNQAALSAKEAEAAREAYMVKSAASAQATQAALEAETVAAEATEAASKNSLLVPIAIAVASALGVGVASYGISGYLSRKKIYEYCQVRLITSHMKEADKDPNTIAMSFVGVNKKKHVPNVILFAYGVGLSNWVNKLIKDNPDLPGSVSTPSGNMTMLSVPLDTLRNTDISAGFKLLYNTQMLWSDKYVEGMCKKNKIDVQASNDLRDYLDGITGNVNIVSKETSEESNINTDNAISKYCQRYKFTEEEFWASEAERLCDILNCNKDELPGAILACELI